MPEIAARHEIGRSAAGASATATAARYRSMQRYFDKHHGRAAARLVRVAGALTFGARRLWHPRDAAARAGLRAFLGPK